MSEANKVNINCNTLFNIFYKVIIKTNIVSCKFQNACATPNFGSVVWGESRIVFNNQFSSMDFICDALFLYIMCPYLHEIIFMLCFSSLCNFFLISYRRKKPQCLNKFNIAKYFIIIKYLYFFSLQRLKLVKEDTKALIYGFHMEDNIAVLLSCVVENNKSAHPVDWLLVAPMIPVAVLRDAEQMPVSFYNNISFFS